jgi:hypothetical protein
MAFVSGPHGSVVAPPSLSQSPMASVRISSIVPPRHFSRNYLVLPLGLRGFSSPVKSNEQLCWQSRLSPQSAHRTR